MALRYVGVSTRKEKTAIRESIMECPRFLAVKISVGVGLNITEKGGSLLNKNAKKWVKALRSGKYKQTKYQLCELASKGKPKGFCCLGVACELAIKDGVKLTIGVDENDRSIRTYSDRASSLPNVVADWLGLNDDLGGFDLRIEEQDCLAELNDKGLSFKQIAKVIESEPEGLFK